MSLRTARSSPRPTAVETYLVGAGVTAVLQSSSATTVMLVGFASAGLLSLRQTIGVVAEPIAHARGKAFVGDADVLADPKPRDGGERAGRGLEDEAHRARLALRGQLVVVGVQHRGLGLAHAEAVLEEGATGDVVLQKLGQAALPRADGLVNGLRLFLGRLADEDLAGLFRAA